MRENEGGGIRNYIAELVKKKSAGGVTSTSSPVVAPSPKSAGATALPDTIIGQMGRASGQSIANFKQTPSELRQPVKGVGGTTSRTSWSESFDPSLYTRPAAELYNRSLQAYNMLPKDEQGSVPLLNPATRMGDQLFFDADKGEISNNSAGAKSVPLYWQKNDDDTRYLSPLADGGTPAFMDKDSSGYLYQYYKMLANPETPEETAVSRTYSTVTPEVLIASQFENKKASTSRTYSYATDLDKLYAAQSVDELNKAREEYGNRVTFGDSGLEKFGYGIGNTAYVPEEQFGAAAKNKGALAGLANIVATFTQGAGLLTSFLNWFGKYYRPVPDYVAQDSAIPIKSMGVTYKSALTETEQVAKQQELQSLQDEAARRINNMTNFFVEASKKDIDKKPEPSANLINTLFNPEKEAAKNYDTYAKASQMHNDAYALMETGTVDGFRKAIDTLTKSYEMESQVGGRNVYASYDWINDPAKEKKFYEIMAQVELQKYQAGEDPLLTRLEVLQLKERFADPTVEFVGQMVFDYLNFLDFPAGDLLTSLPEGKVLNTLRTIVPDFANKDLGGVIGSAALNGIKLGTGKLAYAFREGVADVLPFISKADGVNLFSLNQRAKNLKYDVHYLVGRSFGAGSGDVSYIANTLGDLGNDVASLRSAGKSIDEILTELKASGKYTGDLLTKKRLNVVAQMLDLMDPTAKDAQSWKALVDDSYGKAIDALAQAKLADNVKGLSYTEGLTSAEVKELVQQSMDEAKKWAVKNVSADHVAQDVAETFKKMFIQKNTMEGTKFLKDQFKAVASKVIGPKIVETFSSLYNKWFGAWVKNILGRAPKFFTVFQPMENFLFYHFSRNGTMFDSFSTLIRNNPGLIDNLLDVPLEGRMGFTGALGFDVGDAEDLVAMLKRNKTAWLPTPNSFKYWADASIAQQAADWTKYVDKEFADVLKNSDKTKLFDIVNVSKGYFKNHKVLLFNGKPVSIMPKQVKFAWNAWADAGKNIAAANELIVKSAIAAEQFDTFLTKINPVVMSETLEQFADGLRARGLDEGTVVQLVNNVRNMWNSAKGSSYRLKNLFALADMSKGKVAIQSFVPQEFFARKMAMTAQEQDNFLRSVARDWDNFTTTLNDFPAEKDVDTFIDAMKESYKSDYTELMNPSGAVGRGIFGDALDDAASADTAFLRMDDTQGLDAFDVSGNKLDPAVVNQINSETFWNLPNEERDIVISSFKDSRPDLLSLNEAYAKAGNSAAQFKSKIKQLDEILFKNPADSATHAVYWDLKNIENRTDELYSWMAQQNGFLYFVYPGAKNVPPAQSHEYYVLVNSIKTNLQNQYADYLDRVIKAVNAGEAVPVATMEDYLSWAGFKVGTENGRITSFTFTNPVTGVDSIFDNKTLTAEGMQVDSPQLRRFKAWFRLYDEDMLKSGLNTPYVDKYLKGLQQSGKLLDETPLKFVSPEDFAAEKKLIFDLELQQSLTGDGTPIRDVVEPMVSKELADAGMSMDTISPEDFIQMLRTKADAVGVDEIGKTMKQLADDIEYRLKYFENRYVVKSADVVSAAPINPLISVPEDVRAWTRTKLKNTAQYNAVDTVLDDWRKVLKQKISDGSLVVPEVSAENAQWISKQYNNMLSKMAEMEDVLWHGGNLGGYRLDGAIPFMKERMRVGTETVIDQYMKGIVPFWNFATRGAWAWTTVAMEHPEIIQWYFRELRFSRGQAYKYGAVNSKGQQLQSTKNKIFIPALQLWVDPFAVSPFFKYYLSPTPYEEDEYEDLPPLEEFYYRMRSLAASHGFGVSPVVDIALSMLGAKDLYSDQTWQQKAVYYGLSATMPTDLVPPFAWNYINSVMRKISFADSPDFWNTKVQWHDYLVESQAAADYLIKIKAATTQEQKMALVNELSAALKDREKSDIWNKYLAEVENTDYYKKLSGFFTGIYPKPFTLGESELYRLRDSINIAKDSINNEVGAQIFYPYMDAEQIYEAYSDARYNTPEGALYSVRNAFSWVTDDKTGEQLYGLPRREQIASILDKQAATQGKYEAIGNAWEEYNARMRSIPVGRTYSDPKAEQYRKDLYTELLRIESSPEYAMSDSTWGIGYKPFSMIYDHYRNIWWKSLYLTYPQRDYDGGEKYDEWKVRETEWLANLPKQATEMSSLFGAMLSTIPEGYGGQEFDTKTILSQLAKETNANGMRKWQLDGDTVEEAIMRVWDEMYADKYWSTVDNLSGNMRIQAESEFLKTTPKPDEKFILAGVKSLYGNKFTDQEIIEAMQDNSGKSRTVLDIQQAGDVGQDIADKKYDELWTWYTWTRPDSNILKSVQTQMIKNDPQFKMDNWDKFFNSSSPDSWKDPNDFEKFYQAVKTAIETTGVQAPTGQELQMRVEAEKLNNILKDTIAKELPQFESLSDTYNQLSTDERKIYRKAHPQEYQILKEGWNIRSAFGKTHPIWFRYYDTGTLSASSALSDSDVYKARPAFPDDIGATVEFINDARISQKWLQRMSDVLNTGKKPYEFDLNYAKKMRGYYPKYTPIFDAIIAKAEALLK